jgi:hypothetical protein
MHRSWLHGDQNSAESELFSVQCMPQGSWEACAAMHKRRSLLSMGKRIQSLRIEDSDVFAKEYIAVVREEERKSRSRW